MKSVSDYMVILVYEHPISDFSLTHTHNIHCSQNSYITTNMSHNWKMFVLHFSVLLLSERSSHVFTAVILIQTLIWAV